MSASDELDDDGDDYFYGSEGEQSQEMNAYWQQDSYQNEYIAQKMAAPMSFD